MARDGNGPAVVEVVVVTDTDVVSVETPAGTLDARVATLGDEHGGAAGTG